MMSQNQQQIEIQDTQEASPEGKLVVEIVSDMRKKQLDFLDESGKSLIERVATFLAVLFAVSAFSNNFPPAYLKGNLPAKVLVIVTLVFYLLAMAAALLAIQPRFHEMPLHNVTDMSKERSCARSPDIKCAACASQACSSPLARSRWPR